MTADEAERPEDAADAADAADSLEDLKDEDLEDVAFFGEAPDFEMHLTTKLFDGRNPRRHLGGCRGIRRGR